jgi:hypothetical protein
VGQTNRHTNRLTEFLKYGGGSGKNNDMKRDFWEARTPCPPLEASKHCPFEARKVCTSFPLGISYFWLPWQ